MTRLDIWLHRVFTGHHTLTWVDSSGAVVTCNSCARGWVL